MTNAIPKGTVTPSIPMPELWKSEGGKEAFSQDLSFAQFVRKYFLIGLATENPELAARLKAARKQRFASAAAIALCCWCHASAVASDDEMLRPCHVVRVSRTAQSLRINRSQSFKLAA